MKKIITILTFVFTATFVNGQNLYIKTFGDSKNKPLIFLHGGPGYNAVNFEVTTAQKLADQGFYVIVYDRRGEGRSIDSAAKFTFEQTCDDLITIFKTKKIKKATLIGHSFGGILAAKFTEKFPKKVSSIVLVGAPVSLQETFKTIIAKSKEIYTAKNDSKNLSYIEMLENMDKSSIEYSSYCFGHAMQNGFYFSKLLTPEAKIIYTEAMNNPFMKTYGSQMSFEAPKGFWENEKYTTLDISNNLKNILTKKIPIFGIYGKDDGLYSLAQIEDLADIIGKNNTIYLDNCSHNVFTDQQSKFIEMIKIWNN